MALFLLVLILIVFVAVKIFHWWYNLPEQIGKRGEIRVHNILSHLSDEYHILDDVVLKTERGTTQIDHIVVSKYGIFAIETKNYRGEIYGDDNRQQWTQIIVTNVRFRRKWYKTYTYITKNYFYNPVKQSLGHAYVVKEYFAGWNRINVVPIVVFTGNADISNVCSNHHVIYDKYLKSTIRSYQIVCLSDSDVQSIVDALSEKNVKGEVDNKTHIRNVYAAKNEYDNRIAAGICPRCGGRLVQRNGRYGSFYGCSNYPKCTFTTH
ncbi:MAG: NERD domain-containing protein [Muribaculaceae bacterium]|nr:NERD domain-containing protein [Muribaculaceae bacterium]